MTQTTVVYYKCGKCSQTEFALRVRARDKGEDISYWMGEVSQKIASHHAHTSPFCMSRIMDVRMRANGEFIGQAQ